MKLSLDASAELAQAIGDGLTAFNRTIAGESGYAPVNVSARDDDDGAIKGGVVGAFSYDTLYISLVWIDESLRGQGHGKTMMQMAEAEGRRLGARHAWLSTFSWQARPFYESIGYRCFGEMAISGGKHHRYFMLKEL